MIRRHDNESLALWDRGDLNVKIVIPSSDRPVAYCDGTDEDERELRAIAEEEGTELPTIQRKMLKTGREIWTIGEPPTDEAEWAEGEW